jgi:hypothetical protein
LENVACATVQAATALPFQIAADTANIGKKYHSWCAQNQRWLQKTRTQPFQNGMIQPNYSQALTETDLGLCAEKSAVSQDGKNKIT